MSRCMVTGATGFLGKYLIERLIQNGHDITLLVRNPEQPAKKQIIGRFREQADMIQQHGRDATITVWNGDVGQINFGLNAECSFSEFNHIYHLAAIYDLRADESLVLNTNVTGTEYLLKKLDEDQFSGCLHFVSSIAMAGNFQGEFSERMFAEGQKHNHVYNRSKYESEKLVREKRSAQVDYEIRIYRPSAIVGHSKTGEMERIDGPYYGFLAISALKKILPPWIPLVAPKINILMDMVPVDYVAEAIYSLSMMEQTEFTDDIFCFHLTDPNALTLTEAAGLILKASGGPQMQITFSTDWAKSYLNMVSKASDMKSIELLKNGLLNSLEIPAQTFDAMLTGVRFSSGETNRLLKNKGVVLPTFDTYVAVLWDYYNRHLDPVRNKEQRCEQSFRGKVVLITGGSVGIGFASAKRCAEYGAKLILAARNQEKLDTAFSELLPIAKKNGGSIEVCACDISDLNECDALVEHVLKKYGHVDILFNNAGLSIRRSISKSLDRFHDFQRSMQTNYFGALRILMGFLPSMIERKHGHILYSSTMGTFSPTPRFGAYNASKSAMDAMFDAMAAEFTDRNIYFTSIKFPLVKTEMLAPTKDYDDMPATTPKEAAQMFVDAVLNKPRKQVTGMGMIMGITDLFAPNIMTQLFNYAYKIWPDENEDYPEMEQDRKVVKKMIPVTPI
ncbi:MAG: SDR family oxidoreductase [Deltaproteobacteria bacterium]|nr:SDR family oxidoreductase [Deltaproteobacteria bacterium]